MTGIKDQYIIKFQIYTQRDENVNKYEKLKKYTKEDADETFALPT